LLTASDSVEMPGTPRQVFDTLLDPDTLAAIIPGCHALELSGENTYRADVTVGVGMIRARFDARVALRDLDPPHALRLSGSGTSSKGSAEGSAKIRLTEIEGGKTRLDYDYEASVGGKVASVGGRMLQSASKMIIAQIFTRLSQRLGGAAPKASLWQRIKRLVTGKGGQS
ncbi:MAG TPA: carbon monoxide dehydrogenase subunit G, partial [Modicisalibacter sp.]|nr:carbon monoxide dehydrogenase subunit G [Modicisalibacter sp.]